MKCTKCGFEAGDSNFCPQCGQKMPKSKGLVPTDTASKTWSSQSSGEGSPPDYAPLQQQISQKPKKKNHRQLFTLLCVAVTALL
ncbi:MAG: hypothetical protein LKE53_03055 [Oscillospiraceae bacterium]|nr:hypothetical protein [Oscillospiraceae bacterium]